MRLRTLLFLLFLALSGIPLGILTALHLPTIAARFEQAAQRESINHLDGQAKELNQRLARLHETVRILALLPAPREMVSPALVGREHLQLSVAEARKRFGGLMIRWFAKRPEVQRIAIIDTQGNAQLRLERDTKGHLVSLTEAQPSALAGAPWVSRCMQTGAAGRICVALSGSMAGAPDSFLQIASPIVDKAGVPIGVTLMEAPLSVLLRGFGASLWVSSEGRYVHTQAGKARLSSSAFVDYPGLQRLLRARQPVVWDAPSGAKIAWVPLTLDASAGNILWVGSPVDRGELERWLQDFRLQFLGTVLLLVLFLGVLGNRLAAWVDRLKQEIMYGLERLIDGQAHVRFAWGGPREVRALADELNLLSERYTQINHRREEVEDALFRAKEQAETTLNAIADGVIATGRRGHIEYMNPQAEKLTGHTLAAVHGELFGEILCFSEEGDAGNALDPVADCLSRDRMVTLPFGALLLHPAGRSIAVESGAAPIHDSAGQLSGVVVVVRDVGAQRSMQRQLAYQASHDQLTGLYNRRECENQLSQVLAEVRHNPEECHWVCYVDLDQFKVINDTSGHQAGDALLKQVAAVLAEHVGEHDMLARMGGDEFVVLLRGYSCEGALAAMEGARRALQQMRFAWNGRAFGYTASFGLVPVLPTSASIYELLSTADTACFVAKDEGRNRVYVSEDEDNAVAQRAGEMEWTQKVTQALTEGRFTLYFQSIVTLEDGGAQHFEVLLRMMDERGRVVPPMSFIPAAERYGLMTDVDRWVVSHALDTLAQLERRGELGDSVFAINLSATSLAEPQFLDFVLEQLERCAVAGQRVCFEVTETSAIGNLARATAFIEAVKARGCTFSLDDFGSGLSSFGYLKNLAVDFLKIDGSFVRDMIDDPIDQAMVRAIHEVGDIMGIATIAEYVESQAIVERLREMGVDYGQGFGIAKPIPLDQWAALHGRAARHLAEGGSRGA